MMYRVCAFSLLFLPLVAVAEAASPSLPPVKATADNAVPACVTPGRLMAFIKSRNERLDPRFEKISVDYMRHGERLAVRWDYAFFQMAIETGYLTFDRETGRRGDVSPKQNNFAGMGATGHGESGESFPDVSTGVLAHLQHVLLYAGERIDRPVAERTRKVQEWGILRSWQKAARGPITFGELARRWANNDDAYAEAIGQHAKRFLDDHCNRPDPNPGLVAEARAETGVAADHAPTSGKGSGTTLAKKALEDGKAGGSARRSALGAGAIAKGAAPDATDAGAAKGAPETAAQAKQPEAKADAKAQAAVQPKAQPPQVSKAGAAGGLTGLRPKTNPSAQAQPQQQAAAKAEGRCRVWTASYGGARALIIRSQADEHTNFTVLDVNEGAERREAEAYIQAYAKGGAIVQEFPSSAQALERAFELCPEG